MDKLNREQVSVEIKFKVQIDFAKNELNNIHAIQNTPLAVAFPLLTYLPYFSSKKQEPTGIHEPLISKEEKDSVPAGRRKLQIQGEILDKDPLM